jgi:hypothetical protein
MRRLNPVLRAPVDWVRSLARDWDAFWYTPADPTLLGVLRILTGLMLLYTHAVWGLVLRDFFGPSGWLSADLVRAIQVDPYGWSLWWWVPQDAIWPVHIASMAILGLFTIGLWTRLTSVLALVVAISYTHRVPAATFGLDQINVMLLLYLTIGPSGRALSIDRWLADRRRGAGASEPGPSASANLAIRLIQVHMCVIYFFAGISKLQGVSWWDGTAMWRAFANLEYQSTDMTWLSRHPSWVNVMTHVSVLWEVAFAFLIWRPRWRPLMLAGAVALHVGIGLCLGMWTFGLIMLVGCASFLPGEAVRRLATVVVPRRRRVDVSGAGPLVRPLGLADRADRPAVLEPVLTSSDAEY